MPIISRNQLLPHYTPLAYLSYDRVMDVQNNFRGAVSEQVMVDGVVVPTNIKGCVFVTHVVSNLDESGRYEFHGTAMTLTSHLTNDKIREDPSSLKLDLCEGEHIPLLLGYAIMLHIDEYADDITLPSLDSIPPTQHALFSMQNIHSWSLLSQRC